MQYYSLFLACSKHAMLDHVTYIILLAGNKKDLEDIREVKLQQAQNFAAQHDILEVIETSAKDNTNINEAFIRMAKVILRCSLLLVRRTAIARLGAAINENSRVFVSC